MGPHLLRYQDHSFLLKMQQTMPNCKMTHTMHISSSPLFPCPRSRRGSICMAASSGPSEDKTSKAINEFIRKTTPKVEEAVETLQRKATIAWSKVDDEFDVSSKISRMTRKGKEAALDIDQQWGVRRKYKRYSEDFKRNLPRWSRQFDEFSQTTLGKVTVIVGLFALLASPFFWQLLNWALLAWWIILPIASILTMQKAQEAVKAQQAAAAEEKERRKNPFASIFKTKSSKSAKETPGSKSSPGPVIDADFREIK